MQASNPQPVVGETDFGKTLRSFEKHRRTLHAICLRLTLLHSNSNRWPHKKRIKPQPSLSPATNQDFTFCTANMSSETERNTLQRSIVAVVTCIRHVRRTSFTVHSYQEISVTKILVLQLSHNFAHQASSSAASDLPHSEQLEHLSNNTSLSSIQGQLVLSTQSQVQHPLHRLQIKTIVQDQAFYANPQFSTVCKLQSFIFCTNLSKAHGYKTIRSC